MDRYTMIMHQATFGKVQNFAKSTLWLHTRLQKKLCLLVVSMCLGQLVLGQDKNNWKQVIIDYQQSLQKLTEPKRNQQYFMQMRVSVIPGKDQPVLKATDMQIKMWVRHKQLVYESAHLSVYRDAKESITVVHPLRSIIRADMANQTPSTASMAEFAMVRQRILEEATLTEARATTWKGQPVQRIVMQMQEKVQKKTGVRQVVYFYHLNQKRVIRQEFDYLPGMSCEKQTLDIEQLNFHDKQTIHTHAADYVFANNRPLPQYKQYSFD